MNDWLGQQLICAGNGVDLPQLYYATWIPVNGIGEEPKKIRLRLGPEATSRQNLVQAPSVLVEEIRVLHRSGTPIRFRNNVTPAIGYGGNSVSGFTQALFQSSLNLARLRSAFLCKKDVHRFCNAAEFAVKFLRPRSVYACSLSPESLVGCQELLKPCALHGVFSAGQIPIQLPD